ncbi:unnamed protein product [Chrysoparadoxa australica]
MVLIAEHSNPVNRQSKARCKAPSLPVESVAPTPLPPERAVSVDSARTNELIFGGGDNESVNWQEEDGGRHEFFEAFRHVSAQRYLDPDAYQGKGPTNEDAGRRKTDAVYRFLRRLGDNNRAPWPALIKADQTLHSLKLAGMGIGNDLCLALAAVVQAFDSLQVLDISDNRLGDEAILSIIQASKSMETLQHLDLSENEIGQNAAAELRSYVRSTTCRLKTVILRKADIDDYECAEFMEACKSNTSIQHLDLARNFIGTAETINFLNPDFVTGGEAIADALQINSHLTHLDLGWNCIRQDSAVSLGEALKSNKGLRTLILKYNSFADHPSQVLASSLVENETLTHLDMSYNNMTPAAALVMAFSLQTNCTLSQLILEGNRVGANGGGALIKAMRTSQRKNDSLNIDLKNCDTTSTGAALLSTSNATGHYVLEMKSPYHRVVASGLLKLAYAKPTSRFKSVVHIMNNRRQVINLVRTTKGAGPDARSKIISELATEIRKAGAVPLDLLLKLGKSLKLHISVEVGLKILACWNKSLALLGIKDLQQYSDMSVPQSLFGAMFDMYDEDKTGELEAEELEAVLTDLGQPHGKARIRGLMAKYDSDGSGAIGRDEFMHYMKATHMAKLCREDGILVTEDGKIWQVPSIGTLILDFVEEPNADRSVSELSTDGGVEDLIKNIQAAPSDDGRKKLFELATTSNGVYYTALQAQGLLDSVGSIYSRIDAVAKLLPQIISPQESCAFVDANLDFQTKLKMRIMMGSAWRPIMGMSSGNYALDMQNENDVQTAAKIAAVANEERHHAKNSAQTNTSQKGNWQNFRNEKFNNEDMVLTPSWFVCLPSYGVLVFDYVSTSRPDHHYRPLPEQRFNRLMERIGLREAVTEDMPIAEEVISPEALNELGTSHWRRFCASSEMGKIPLKEYYKSGNNPDDVSQASWFSSLSAASMVHAEEALQVHGILGAVPAPAYIKAYYKLLELEVLFCSSCMSVDQLARLLEKFPRCHQIRAEVVIAFFHRIVDLDKLVLLVDTLRPDEQREIYGRLGYLNVLNPLYVDRYYYLDLTVWDHREMAKILIVLAVEEPGENWLDETYCRSREHAPIYGWELPLDWCTEEKGQEGGPRRYGILTMWYTSDPALQCEACIPVRMELMDRVLCSTCKVKRDSHGIVLQQIEAPLPNPKQLWKFVVLRHQAFGAILGTPGEERFQYSAPNSAAGSVTRGADSICSNSIESGVGQGLLLASNQDDPQQAPSFEGTP